MKNVFGFLLGLITGASLIMLYLHRDAIAASLTDGEMPEAPESCPFSKKDSEKD
ncbi:MAG: hypothetical protein II127_07975 [Ruminococcus sp.]|nr:hypothetical protein [Ruminococcus sp.]